MTEGDNLLVVILKKCHLTKLGVAHLRYKCYSRFSILHHGKNGINPFAGCAPLPQLGFQGSMHTSSRGNDLWIVNSCIQTEAFPGEATEIDWNDTTQKKHAMSCSLILKSNKIKCVTFQKQRDLSQNNANCAADLESNDLGKCYIYIYMCVCVFACICLGNSHLSGEGL